MILCMQSRAHRTRFELYVSSCLILYLSFSHLAFLSSSVLVFLSIYFSLILLSCLLFLFSSCLLVYLSFSHLSFLSLFFPVYMSNFIIFLSSCLFLALTHSSKHKRRMHRKVFKELSLCHKLEFLINLFFQLNVVDLRYFKL